MQNTSPISVIQDVDTGVDDALALLYAVLSPELNVCAVMCVHGNVHVDMVLRNTLKVVDAAEAPSDLPVARGDHSQCAVADRPENSSTANRRHGRTKKTSHELATRSKKFPDVDADGTGTIGYEAVLKMMTHKVLSPGP